MPDVITIDGPSASGKSSVARRVAAGLGLPYVSSGLIYRGVTYQVGRYGVDPQDEAAILHLLSHHPIQLVPLPEGNRMLAEGQDVTAHMHTLEIDQAVSAVARHPEVRAYVYRSLRALQPPFVVEGRDMGSTVFPDAALKFYLTAAPEVRARRRVGERDADYATVLADLLRRDAADAKQIPPAPDAIIIDTSAMGLEEVVNTILERIRTRTP
ncbi:Cytidylate kinase [Calidithermus terrae]|uniref:Cytidylate kinase n=1 Tax=Calidithermus terrae TaxID=1408545 RepID=A0A399EQV2_9DEIN|nr:(d)CMP kinase [Calidithermus terrae]RIH86245.1 Cytidylate kinase [Calidithermus terrae]